MGTSLVSKSFRLGDAHDDEKQHRQFPEMSGSMTEPIKGYCWKMETNVSEIGKQKMNEQRDNTENMN